MFLSVVLLIKDADSFYKILIRHQQAAISYIKFPSNAKKWKMVGRIFLKSVFIFIFLFYRGYHYQQLYAAGKTFKLPLEDGIERFAGLCNVADFKINNKVLTYSPDDPLRWQNVVSEKFNTISIKIANHSS